jgi:hypothetical protein
MLNRRTLFKLIGALDGLIEVADVLINADTASVPNLAQVGGVL